jgi:hypothetical protein
MPRGRGSIRRRRERLRLQRDIAAAERSQRPPPRPQHTVVVWQNGAVTVFDADGQQMPAYQGDIARVRDRVRALVPEHRWCYRIWHTAAANSATEGWKEGRAREIARARAIAVDVARVMAANEDARGCVIYDPRAI